MQFIKVFSLATNWIVIAKTFLWKNPTNTHKTNIELKNKFSKFKTPKLSPIVFELFPTFDAQVAVSSYPLKLLSLAN